MPRRCFTKPWGSCPHGVRQVPLETPRPCHRSACLPGRKKLPPRGWFPFDSATMLALYRTSAPELFPYQLGRSMIAESIKGGLRRSLGCQVNSSQISRQKVPCARRVAILETSSIFRGRPQALGLWIGDSQADLAMVRVYQRVPDLTAVRGCKIAAGCKSL